MPLTYSFNSNTITRLRSQQLARGTVLDLGCADGAAAQQLREICADRLIGVELDRTAALSAAKLYDKVYSGNVQNILPQLADECFSLIICSDLLEHVYDPLLVLHECHRLIAPHGRLFISTSNLSNVGNLLRIFVTGEFDYMGDYSHIRLMTPRMVGNLVQQAGFCVESCFYDVPTSTRVLTRTAAAALSFIARPHVNIRSFLSTNTVMLCSVTGK
jgi:predicted TPR repeat methyltransferase